MARRAKKSVSPKKVPTEKKTLKESGTFRQKKGGDASSGTGSTGPRKTK